MISKGKKAIDGCDSLERNQLGATGFQLVLPGILQFAENLIIRGLRITVYDVLDYLASGMTVEEILDDFPELTREDILACLAFAADRERRLAQIPA